jgi:radical SAM protein (TIGR01212 family)
MNKKKHRRYYKFSKYLKERFGEPVYKVSIDAGFSCPNKDGRLGEGGCIYCDNRAFSHPVRNSISDNGASNSRISMPPPIEEQVKNGIEFGKRRYGAKKFMVYFQAYTNTYLPEADMPADSLVAGAKIDKLKQKYDVVKKFKDIVALAIGTRPDCVNKEILDLIESYTKDYAVRRQRLCRRREVWIEYGLQSIHDKTLRLINRNHTYEDFVKAVKMTQKRNIKICAHIIIGLPEETKDEILETAKALAELNVDAVKIHPLHIVKDTKLEELYKKGRYKPLGLENYVDLAVKFLEYLPPDTVIQRISADCPKELLVAPDWILNKQLVLNMIEKRLEEKDTHQGILYSVRGKK